MNPIDILLHDYNEVKAEIVKVFVTQLAQIEDEREREKEIFRISAELNIDHGDLTVSVVKKRGGYKAVRVDPFANSVISAIINPPKKLRK